MKTRILAVAAVLLVSTMVSAQCHAQTTIAMKGNVPFAFTVGDKTLPAGEYSVQNVIWGNESVQLIRSLGGSDSFVVGTLQADGKNNDSSPCLVFHRYGDQYFLSQIWYGSDSGRELSKSRREKELAGHEAPREVAVMLGAPAGQP